MDTGSILVVDDDLDIASNFIDILTDMGYDADAANDGKSALQLVRERPYDVALLDFKMPDMDGATLYGEIKTLQPDLVAIMVTAYAENNGIERAKEAGVWQVLRKPIDFGALLGCLDEALHQPLVLVVDDDADFCSTLWQLLRDRNYRVGLAHDEQTARQKIRTRPYETVILDMKLGDKSGEDVFASFEAIHPRPQTVIVTGCRTSTDDCVSKLIKRGAEAVCYKPIDMTNFLETLDELTERKNSARGNEG